MNSARFFSIFANYIAADFTCQIAYKESLVKETDDFICELKSKGIPGNSKDISFRRKMPNTLVEIIVKVKQHL